MLDTSFWCLTPGFLVLGIIWNHFREPEIDLKVKNRVEEAKDNFRECNSKFNMLWTWCWYPTLCFGVWGITWDHFCEPQIDLKVKNGVDWL